MATKASVERKTKVSVVMVGFILILVPAIIGFLLCMPTFGQWIMNSKGELFKGAVIGFSSLPIFLFITIKGGERWFKSWWTWSILSVVLILMVVVVFVSKGSVQGSEMGGAIPSGKTMMGRGIPLG